MTKLDELLKHEKYSFLGGLYNTQSPALDRDFAVVYEEIERVKSILAYDYNIVIPDLKEEQQETIENPVYNDIPW